MKRFLIFPCILSLVIGLLVGVLLPINLTEDPARTPSNGGGNNFTPPNGTAQPEGSASPADAPASLDASDNLLLLSTASSVCRAIRHHNWTTLASYVHPSRGVTFTPYSTVDPDSDLCFTASQVKNMAQDSTVYTWGFEDGRGDPIQLTMEQYFARYVGNADYTQVPMIGIDHIITGGNALENLTEAYADCRFVDFCFPSSDPVNDGLDWTSLKLVFQAGPDRWYLVGVVHGEWTI